MIDLYIVILALCVSAIVGIIGCIHYINNDIADLYWMIEKWNEEIAAALEEVKEEEEESYKKSDNQLTGYQ